MALSTSSVTVNQVKTALGSSDSAVIALCKSGKTNKWSGTKPFKSSADKYTYAQLVAALKAANFGLSLTGKSTAAQALNLAAGSSELWPHEKPPGTSSYPCRLGDFRGYNHSAPVPYSATVSPNPITTGESNGSFEVEIVQDSNAEVIVSQMPTFSGGKWVCLWRPSGGSTSVANGSNVSSASFPLPEVFTVEGLSTEGTYECCAAILVNGLYYAVPNTYKTFTISVLPKPLILSWSVCEWNEAFTEISFEIAVQNNRSGAQTLNPLTITLRETTPSGSPASGNQPSGSSPAYFTSDSVSVPGNGTVTVKTGKFTGITYDSSKVYYVCAMSTSGSQMPFQYTVPEEVVNEEI